MYLADFAGQSAGPAGCRCGGAGGSGDDERRRAFITSHAGGQRSGRLGPCGSRWRSMDNLPDRSGVAHGPARRPADPGSAGRCCSACSPAWFGAAPRGVGQRHLHPGEAGPCALAGMQWDLLPPLSEGPSCYAMRADRRGAGARLRYGRRRRATFDYAINGADLASGHLRWPGARTSARRCWPGLSAGAYRPRPPETATVMPHEPPSTRPWPETITTIFRSPPASSPGWPPGPRTAGGTARGHAAAAAARAQSSPSSAVIRCCRSDWRRRTQTAHPGELEPDDAVLWHHRTE